MCAAAARTEKKYSIPRNAIIPEQSALDVLISGSLMKSRDGSVEGYAMPLFRAGSEAGVQFSMQKRGVMYYFKYGHVYVYDQAKTDAARLFEGAATAASFVLPGVSDLAGGLSTLVEKGGDLLLEKVTEKINEGPHQSQATYGDQLAMLERRGVVVLPGANLVDVEYQIEPAGFLSQEAHRQIFTYEDHAHQLSRYQFGAPMKGNKSEQSNTVIAMALTARKWSELASLFDLARDEFAPGFDAIRSEMQTAFDQKHGEGTAIRTVDFANEVSARYQAEIERNGYTPVAGARRVLELLKLMWDVYDTTPVLDKMMQELRAFATGEAA